MKSLSFPLLILFISLTHQTNAQLVVFSFNGAAGNESTVAPDSQPANATVSSMSRGSGITASANSGTFSSVSWTTSTSLDLSDYYSFSVTPTSPYHMTLSSLALDEKRSSTGILNWSVRSSLDNFGSDLSVFSVPDDTLMRTAQTTLLNSAFQNLYNGVEFRIYGYAAESGTGSWKIDNVQVSGSLSAVPEPEEYALITGLGLLLFTAFRKRARLALWISSKRPESLIDECRRTG